ncbi:MAG: hypothetical protein KDA21_08925, partial [Phycisphaerales bacterium]|nr:hypothetical protein [Phycisphaerales bacterium]
PWLMRLLAHKASDRIRSRRRERRRRRPTADVPTFEAQSGDDLLERALAALPPERRALLLLHTVNGIPLQAVAATLGIPEGTAKSRLHHTRALLRSLMKGTEHERD